MSKQFKLNGKAILALSLIGAITQAQAGVTVYVPTGGANEIIVINGETDKISRNILDITNVHGLSASPDGKTLVAGNMWEAPKGQNPATPRPAGVSEEDHNAHHGGAAKQAMGNDRPGKSFISLVNAENQQLIRRIEVTGRSHHTSVTPDGRYSVSTQTSAGGISIVDLQAGEVLSALKTGPQPNFILISKEGSRAYVSNAGNNTISEIDTTDWRVIRNIPTGAQPEHMVFSADGSRLYVNNVKDGKVAEITLADGKTSNLYTVGKDPHGIDLSDDGTQLFVSAKSDNKLVAINLENGEQRDVTLSPLPYHVTAIKGTGKLYVTSRMDPRIWVLDQNTLKVTGEIPIKGVGHQMVVVQN